MLLLSPGVERTLGVPGMIQRTSSSLTCERTAWYSPDEIYRYGLLITWDTAKKTRCFIGLNPSTATEEQDDPTIRRCIDFSMRWGSGGLLMLNACAFRATDPKVMLSFDGDKIGPENTISWLEKMIVGFETGPPVAAWGRNAKLVKIPTFDSRLKCPLNRADELRVMLGPMDCLGKNKDGTPVHPLYQSSDLVPVPYNYSPGVEHFLRGAHTGTEGAAQRGTVRNGEEGVLLK